MQQLDLTHHSGSDGRRLAQNKGFEFICRSDLWETVIQNLIQQFIDENKVLSNGLFTNSPTVILEHALTRSHTFLM